MSKGRKGLYHESRKKILLPSKIEESLMYIQLRKRTHHKTWGAAIRIVDNLIDSIEDGTGPYDWARLSSLLGHKGSASMRDSELTWRMCYNAAKKHDVLTKKMLGLFLMWRFAHRDGWHAYTQDTGKYDAISEKEITVTCYIKRR